MENSAHENEKDAFLYKQHVMTRPHLLDMRKEMGYRNCVVIWKDAYGKVHRDFATNKIMALLQFNYPIIRIRPPKTWPSILPFREEPVLKEVLYLFTVKKYHVNEYPGY